MPELTVWRVPLAETPGTGRRLSWFPIHGGSRTSAPSSGWCFTWTRNTGVFSVTEGGSGPQRSVTLASGAPLGIQLNGWVRLRNGGGGLWTKNAAYHISKGFAIKLSASMAALTVSPEGPQDGDKQVALLATTVTPNSVP